MLCSTFYGAINSLAFTRVNVVLPSSTAQKDQNKVHSFVRLGAGQMCPYSGRVFDEPPWENMESSKPKIKESTTVSNHESMQGHQDYKEKKGKGYVPDQMFICLEAFNSLNPHPGMDSLFAGQSFYASKKNKNIGNKAGHAVQGWVKMSEEKVARLNVLFGEMMDELQSPVETQEIVSRHMEVVHIEIEEDDSDDNDDGAAEESSDDEAGEDEDDDAAEGDSGYKSFQGQGPACIDLDTESDSDSDSITFVVGAHYKSSSLSH